MHADGVLCACHILYCIHAVRITQTSYDSSYQCSTKMMIRHGVSMLETSGYRRRQESSRCSGQDLTFAHLHGLSRSSLPPRLGNTSRCVYPIQPRSDARIYHFASHISPAQPSHQIHPTLYNYSGQCIGATSTHADLAMASATWPSMSYYLNLTSPDSLGHSSCRCFTYHCSLYLWAQEITTGAMPLHVVVLVTAYMAWIKSMLWITPRWRHNWLNLGAYIILGVGMSMLHMACVMTSYPHIPDVDPDFGFYLDESCRCGALTFGKVLLPNSKLCICLNGGILCIIGGLSLVCIHAWR